MCPIYVVTITMDTGERVIYVVEFPSSRVAIKKAIDKLLVSGTLGSIARIDAIRADGKIL